MIIFDLILTLFGYLIFPIYYRTKNGTVPLKKAKKLALINSIVVSVIFELIQISLAIMLNDPTYVPSFAPALLYYWIAKAILKEKSSTVTALEPPKKSDTAYQIIQIRRHLTFFPQTYMIALSISWIKYLP